MDDKHIDKSQDEVTEFHIPLLHDFPTSLIDYLPRDARVFIDDLMALQDAFLEVEDQAVTMRQEYIAEGILREDFDIPYLSWSEINDVLSKLNVMELGPSTNLEENKSSDLAQWFRPGPRFGGQLKPFMEHMHERIEAGDQVTVVSRQASRLQELWREREYLLDSLSASPQFIQGNLADGWLYSMFIGLALIRASGRILR